MGRAKYSTHPKISLPPPATHRFPVICRIKHLFRTLLYAELMCQSEPSPYTLQNQTLTLTTHFNSTRYSLIGRSS